MPSPANANIAVIGGGISGLVCAWRLRRRGLPVLLLERGPRFGGVISTVEQEGFRFDVGPQSFTATEPLLALIDELGLGGELLRSNPRAPRYILRRGRLVAAPLAPPQLLASSLLGWRTKLRLLAEPLRRSRPPAEDESVAAFVRRKFGEDLLENLVAPFVSGIYAGDPEKLSLASAFPAVRRLEEQYGSVIRGAILLRSAMKKRAENEQQEAEAEGEEEAAPRGGQCNFRGGIAALTAALAAKLGDVALCGAEAVSLRRAAPSEGGAFRLEFRRAGETVSVAAAAAVIATPAYAAARLLAGIDPRFAAPLERIEYARLAQVSAAYARDRIRGRGGKGLAGFGFLVPGSEHLRTLGVVWNSSLFPGRASGGSGQSAGSAALCFTSFAGGATDPEIASWNEEKIAATVHDELAGILGIEGQPAARHVTRWERALPQYNLGHARIVEELRQLCAAAPGVFLAGNYLGGPSLGACVEQAGAAAEAAAPFAGAAAS